MRVLAFILAALVPGTAPAAPLQFAKPRIAVTIRIYRVGDLSSSIQERALVEAARVLRTAFVDVRWQQCTAGSESPACVPSPGPSELVLRFVDGPSRRGRSRVALGEAVVTPCANGVLATVYLDRVWQLAESAKARVALVLGRVVAHEVGHLLMRTAVHPQQGLMRSQWTVDELRRNRAADWAFTVQDVAEMHRQRGW